MVVQNVHHLEFEQVDWRCETDHQAYTCQINHDWRRFTNAYKQYSIERSLIASPIPVPRDVDQIGVVHQLKNIPDANSSLSRRSLEPVVWLLIAFTLLVPPGIDWNGVVHWSKNILDAMPSLLLRRLEPVVARHSWLECWYEHGRTYRGLNLHQSPMLTMSNRMVCIQYFPTLSCGSNQQWISLTRNSFSCLFHNCTQIKRWYWRAPILWV